MHTIHHFNGHFPDESGLAGCLLNLRGVEASFYRQSALSLTGPTASKH